MSVLLFRRNRIEIRCVGRIGHRSALSTRTIEHSLEQITRSFGSFDFNHTFERIKPFSSLSRIDVGALHLVSSGGSYRRNLNRSRCHSVGQPCKCGGGKRGPAKCEHPLQGAPCIPQQQPNAPILRGRTSDRARRKQEAPRAKMMRQVGGCDQGPIDRRSAASSGALRPPHRYGRHRKMHSLEILLVSLFCPAALACRHHEPDQSAKYSWRACPCRKFKLNILMLQSNGIASSGDGDHAVWDRPRRPAKSVTPPSR
jgi:hypothetical protein